LGAGFGVGLAAAAALALSSFIRNNSIAALLIHRPPAGRERVEPPEGKDSNTTSYSSRVFYLFSLLRERPKKKNYAAFFHELEKFTICREMPPCLLLYQQLQENGVKWTVL
jgi:hypothetical protein